MILAVRVNEFAIFQTCLFAVVRTGGPMRVMFIAWTKTLRGWLLWR